MQRGSRPSSSTVSGLNLTQAGMVPFRLVGGFGSTPYYGKILKPEASLAVGPLECSNYGRGPAASL